MLTVRFENNSDCISIYKQISLNDEVSGTNFVMYDEQTPVAVFKMHIVLEDQPVAVIDRIFFKDGVEEGDKIFFKHAIFFKLIEGTPILIRIEGINEEFKKYGFVENNGNMEVISKEINLHYMCGKI